MAAGVLVMLIGTLWIMQPKHCCMLLSSHLQQLNGAQQIKSYENSVPAV